MRFFTRHIAVSRTFRNLLLISAILIVLTSLLSLWMVRDAWVQYHTAQNNLMQFEYFNHVLEASNALASERAYSNELILEQKGAKDAAWQALVTSRARTDAMLTRIPKHLLSASLMKATRSQLVISRQGVDAFRHRTIIDPVEAQQAISSMLRTTDFYHEALFLKTTEFIKREPSAAGPILRAQALGELRDTAGRIGSSLLIPLATETTVPQASREFISGGLERIKLLLWLLGSQGAETSWLPEFQNQVADAASQFEKEGAALIRQLEEQSGKKGGHVQQSEEFARKYHASLHGLNALLDVYMNGLKEHYMTQKKLALMRLFAIVLTILTVYALTVTAILYFRSRILSPILRLNNIADTIIDGQASDSVMPDAIAEEVQSLFSSLGALGERLREQTILSKRFKRQSEEDTLTQLLNRRAFDYQAETLLLLATREYPAWLVILDVDRFKSINDRWGHTAGDTVLIALGEVLRQFSLPGEGDIVARIGGEEFAMMFRTPEAQDAIGYVQRIQNAIRQLELETHEGERFHITASFGVASGYQKPLSALFAEADAQLYRAKNSGRDRICQHS